MKTILVLLSAVSCAIFLFPATYSNAASTEPQDLITSGKGTRTKGILGTIYYATLYIPKDMKGRAAREIVEADRPMSVVMEIDSRLLTRSRFVEAINEGFAGAATSGYPTGKKDAFLKLFDGMELAKGDVISLSYTPAEGLTARFSPRQSVSAKVLGTVQGVEFKKALFAIWLGPTPVQESLKKEMLGQ
jgi:hypothetical protein